MEKITQIKAKVVDLGDWSTVRVMVETEHGFRGHAELPAGISVGKGEAQLIDPDHAVQNIQTIIAPKLISQDALEQREIDQILMDLDGTPDRSKLGVNSLLPVSMAVIRVGAQALKRELYEHIAHLANLEPKIPRVIEVLIEGGKHVPDSILSIQEFSVIDDAQFLRAKDITNAIRVQCNKLGIECSVAGQGGVGAKLRSNDQALDLINSVLDKLDIDVELAIDVAATHTGIQLQEIEDLMAHYPIKLVEDPIPEGDHPAWIKFTKKYGHDHIIAADDLTLGNPRLIKDAVKTGVANSLVIKLNQTATVSELFDLINLVKVGNWIHIVSHRGHEVPDDFIADLAVGTGAQYLKAGNPADSDRASKYTRLKTIYRHLKTNS